MHWYPLYLTSDPEKTAFCCLKSVLAHHHYYHDWKWLAEDLDDYGWNMEGLIYLLEKYGIDYTSYTSFEEAIEIKRCPMIVNIGQQCILVMKVKPKLVFVMDPMHGYRKLSVSTIKDTLVLQCICIGFIGRYSYRRYHLWPFCLQEKNLNILMISYLGLSALFMYILNLYGYATSFLLDIGQGIGGIFFLWLMAKKLACKTEIWEREWSFLKDVWIKETYWQCLSFYMQLLWCGWLLECFLFTARTGFLILFQMIFLGWVSHVLWCCSLPNHFCITDKPVYWKNYWNFFGILMVLCTCHVLFIFLLFYRSVPWHIIRSLLYFGITALFWRLFYMQFYLWREKLSHLQFIIDKQQAFQPLETINEITFCRMHVIITLQHSGGFSNDILYLPIVALGNYKEFNQWDIYLNGYRISRYAKKDYLDKIHYYGHFIWDERLALRSYLGESGTKMIWRYQLLTVEIVANQKIYTMSIEAKEIAAFVYHYLNDNLLDIYAHCLDHLSYDNLKKVIKLIELEKKKWVILIHPQIKLVNPSFEYAIMMHEEGGS